MPEKKGLTANDVQKQTERSQQGSKYDYAKKNRDRQETGLPKGEATQDQAIKNQRMVELYKQTLASKDTAANNTIAAERLNMIREHLAEPSPNPDLLEYKRYIVQAWQDMTSSEKANLAPSDRKRLEELEQTYKKWEKQIADAEKNNQNS